MSRVVSEELLRDGLLGGRVVAMAGADGVLATEVAGVCRGLGASVVGLEGANEDELAASVARVNASVGAIDVLVCDGDGLFSAAGADGLEALRECVDRSWDATHAVANAAFIPSARGGKVMLLAPRASSGEYSRAARAALENTARTLSIEWARHQIVTTAIAPGAATGTEEVATLVAFIASCGGDYYSGCTFELGSL